MILHVARRELAARWILLPAAIVIGALAMIAIQSIGHVRGDADGIMNGTWIGTLVVSTIVGMSLLGDELTNSRLSFYFARPFSPHAIFGGKLAAGVLVALLVQIAIMILVALALPELSWRGSALAQRDVLSVGGERVLATIGCTLLGLAASIALGSKTRWLVVDALCIAVVGVIGTWFALRLEPDPAWLPADSIRSVGEKALFHAAVFAVAAIGLGAATARAFVLGRTDRMRAHRTMSTTLWPIVVSALLALIVIGEQTEPSIPDAPVNALVTPAVEPATVVETEGERLPYLLVVDDTGKVRVGAAASWAKLDAKRVRLARPTTVGGPEEPVERFLRAGNDQGISGDLAVASVSRFDTGLEREEPLREAARASLAVSERLEAQMETRRGLEGVFTGRGTFAERESRTERTAGIFGLPVDRGGAGYPSRSYRVLGSIHADRNILWRRALVVAAPTVPAKSLIDVITATRASIAVSRADRVRPLRIIFGEDGSGRRTDWVEVRVTRAQILVEAVPSTPVEITDIKDLAAAIDRVRGMRGIDAREEVDVLVDADVDAQRLVDILVALDVAGVRAIGIGPMPDAVQLALRGHQIPTVSMRCVPRCEQLAAEVLRVNRARIIACYNQAHVDNANLANVKVAIEPDRKVTSATASGVDPALAECISGVFRTSSFRARAYSKTGGLYEYEVTLRP